MKHSHIVASHTFRPLTEIQFCAWVAQAIPGDRLEYHRGYLAVDADKVTSDLDPNARAELACLRDRAFWSETAGLVHLVQQRLGPDCFAYLAIARPKTSRTERAVAQLAEAA
ncbi:hypothetical protein [Marivita sp.]|uniref:hypothetical protein n=1 Tax=Marivita sp. TaxID=2003365 RepID=UPI00262F9C36|nr:hypothetical protein [Marivita sp.]